ncbi:MAG: glycosyltransferase family 39 protein [Verrucomicrobiales bacterium]|nr:glycosyltransferase family 39 protein [Verrucomicrobiales bacterium]
MRCPSSLFLFIFALLLLIPGTVTLPLMDRDEPRFAQATLEMMETDQWVIPYFNGEYRFDKPPLTYWWMRIHYLILGKGELAARLHSILAAGLTALVIARIGSFLYSPRAGILAGIGFLTCLQTLVHGRLCVADMAMILGVTATMDAMVRYLFRDQEWKGLEKWGHFGYLSLALAFGFLAKGPIAWIIPCLSLALFVWPFGRGEIESRWRTLGRIPWLSSFAIATGICLLWAVPALIQTKGEFFNVGIGTHVIERGLQPFNGRKMIPGVYYLATIIPSLLPWSAFTWHALFRGGLPESDPKRSLLLAWYLAPFLVFSFYSTQLPHYVMPGFAAFFLLLFRGGRLPTLENQIEKRWFLATALGTLVVTAGGMILLAFAQQNMEGEMRNILPVLFLGLGAVCFVGGVVPFLILLTNRPAAASQSHAIFRQGLPLIAVYLIGTAWITSLLAEKLREVNLVSRVENHLIQSGIPKRLVSHAFGEPSLVFYLADKTRFQFGSGVDTLIKENEGLDKETKLLVRSKTWSVFEGFLQTPHLPKLDESGKILNRFDGSNYRIDTVHGYNPARTTWEEILLISPGP